MTTYNALVIGLFTGTGGVTGTLCRVEAAHGSAAIALICEAKEIPEHFVYLLSAEEVAVWETEGVRVETL